ncbi:MAG: RluA family pseudouridine synthase [Bowdeniella nasicola]|nr:RluA family pseudouridine synthase [Bowdeniella nasicola]
MSSERRYLPVPDALVGQRADVALARLLGMSRSKVAALIDDGNALADGVPLAKANPLGADMMLDITIPAPPTPPPDLVVDGMRIVHEDGDLIVVDKPVGIAAHQSTGWHGPTVVGSLRASGVRITGLGPVEREGIVHRLDVGTSGLMVVAKSDRAYSALKRAFKERSVTKRYLALAHGRVEPARGTIDAPIAHAGGKAWKMAIRPTGKNALTNYEVLEYVEGASLLDVDLLTGRTHQIRVHLASIHHPLLGDLIYGADRTLAEGLGLTRQWLHAYRLGFTHPGTGEDVEFVSEAPSDLTDALDRLREPGGVHP